MISHFLSLEGLVFFPHGVANTPLVTFTGTLDAIFKEISSELRALLLVVVGVGAVFFGVSLGGGLEVGRGRTGT